MLARAAGGACPTCAGVRALATTVRIEAGRSNVSFHLFREQKIRNLGHFRSVAKGISLLKVVSNSFVHKMYMGVEEKQGSFGSANFNPNDCNAGDLLNCIQYRTRMVLDTGHTVCGGGWPWDPGR
jgi:hypothetical protein